METSKFCPPAGVNGAASVVAHKSAPGQRAGTRSRKCKPVQLALDFPSLDLPSVSFHPGVSRLSDSVYFDRGRSDYDWSEFFHGPSMDAPYGVPSGSVRGARVSDYEVMGIAHVVRY